MTDTFDLLAASFGHRWVNVPKKLPGVAWECSCAQWFMEVESGAWTSRSPEEWRDHVVSATVDGSCGVSLVVRAAPTTSPTL